MKNGMPLRETIGKESTYLKSKKSKNSNQSTFRPINRIESGAKSEFPSSKKVGVGTAYVKRGFNVNNVRH